jgi:predicted nucleic acid-binding protein
MAYAEYEDVARRRVPRDPRDWPTVALALALEAGIWTADTDFLGYGVPTWTTDTLLLDAEA